MYSLMTVNCSPNMYLPLKIAIVKLFTDRLHFFFFYKPLPWSQVEIMPGFTWQGYFLHSDNIPRVRVFKFL